MTKPRFGKRLGFAAIMAVAFAAPSTQAQPAQEAEPAPPKAGKLINAGDVLSGELNAMKVRGGKRGGRIATTAQQGQVMRFDYLRGFHDDGNSKMSSHHHLLPYASKYEKNW